MVAVARTLEVLRVTPKALTAVAAHLTGKYISNVNYNTPNVYQVLWKH